MPIIIGGGGGGGGLRVLFSSTLGGDAASIGTGANGIAAGHGELIAYIVTRTADAGAAVNVQVTVNGDTGAHYDAQFDAGNNATPVAGNSLAAANWQIESHGSGGTAGYPGVIVLEIPAYDATTFFKVGTAVGSAVDGTAANNQGINVALGWRSTAAINQLTVTGATANLKAGSRLVVYGTQ